ncbi:MAG: histidinol dehydrogenase, partial [Bryobacter sp.]|nr:histidinol dehydrogenase [Bryobacter sp.]
MLRILESNQADALLKRKAARFEEAEAVVRPIIADVKKRGDKALIEYARKFDRLPADMKSVRLNAAVAANAHRAVSREFLKATKEAAKNIRAYAKFQLPETKKTTLAPGLVVGQIVRPLDVAACYVPAGRYPLPSTLLMTAVPALAAGVPRVVVCTPNPVPEILALAHALGGLEVYWMGGAQAIAAFAFGTKTVPRADRIVGPGNIYVAAAKKLLAGEVGIEFIAGPTEILIIAKDGDPRWIAADMLAQAEHDTDASAVLLTTSRRLAVAVQKEVERQLTTLPTAKTARIAIDRNSAAIIVRDLEEAAGMSNRFAPEHLSLHHPELLPLIRHAGGVFLGPLS